MKTVIASVVTIAAVAVAVFLIMLFWAACEDFPRFRYFWIGVVICVLLPLWGPILAVILFGRAMTAIGKGCVDARQAQIQARTR